MSWKNLFKTEEKPDLCLFAIYDSKAGNWPKPPSYSKNGDTIIRDIKREFRTLQDLRENHIMSNAEDYQLFMVGSYSFKTGQIEGFKPVHICNFFELKSDLIRDLSPAPGATSLVDLSQLGQSPANVAELTSQKQ